jgi:hypothetical protein
MIVPTNSPPIMVTANGAQISDPDPLENASGVIASIVVALVQTTGLSLLRPPSTIAE